MVQTFEIILGHADSGYCFKLYHMVHVWINELNISYFKYVFLTIDLHIENKSAITSNLNNKMKTYNYLIIMNIPISFIITFNNIVNIIYNSLHLLKSKVSMLHNTHIESNYLNSCHNNKLGVWCVCDDRVDHHLYNDINKIYILIHNNIT